MHAAATTPRLLGTQQIALTTCRVGLWQQHVLRVEAPRDIRGQLHANRTAGLGLGLLPASDAVGRLRPKKQSLRIILMTAP